jgi:hypothetical protein
MMVRTKLFGAIGPDCEEEAVATNKWKLMLVDFGFARALEGSEVMTEPKARNTWLYCI